MARSFVFAIFAFIAAAKAPTAWHSAVAAHDQPSFNAISLAAYDALRLAVMTTFATLVALRPPSVRASRTPVAFVACAGAIAAIVLLQGTDGSSGNGVLVVADVLMVAACLWQLVAVLTLGRCFGILPEARGLVVRGPYKLVRHPVYLGEFGACAGLVLGAPTAWNFLCGGAFVFFQAVRMRLEEQALTGQFPEYTAYAAATPRLVPRVWMPGRAAAVTLLPSAGDSTAA